jgi:hypothetical protein
MKTGHIRRLTDEIDNISAIEWAPDGGLILLTGIIYV